MRRYHSSEDGRLEQADAGDAGLSMGAAAQFTLSEGGSEAEKEEDDDFTGFASHEHPPAPPEDEDDGFGDFAAPPDGKNNSFATTAEDEFGGFSEAADGGAGGGDDFGDDDFGDFDDGGGDDFDAFASSTPAPPPAPVAAPALSSAAVMPQGSFAGDSQSLRHAAQETMRQGLPIPVQTALGCSSMPLQSMLLQVLPGEGMHTCSCSAAPTPHVPTYRRVTA